MAKDLKFRINSNTSPAEIDKKIEMMYDSKRLMRETTHLCCS